VNLAPAAARGSRILQIDHDGGRDETYVFVPAVGGEPMRAPYRSADPFLSTWHEIGPDEPPAAIRALADYEVLAMQPSVAHDEAVYRMSLRSLTPRGYDRTELLIARADYAILEQRQYSDEGVEPVLIALAPRGSMVRFGDHLVPARIRYRNVADGSETEVVLRYAPLPAGSGAQFYPGTFHRAPLADGEPAGAVVD
jgi:hypothetical protein